MNKKINRILMRRGIGALAALTIVVMVLSGVNKKDYFSFLENDVEQESQVKAENLEEVAKSPAQFDHLPGELLSVHKAKYLEESSVKIVENVMENQLVLVLPDKYKEYYQENPVSIANPHLRNFNCQEVNGETRLTFTFDKVYAFEVGYDNAFIYIQFMTPKEKYDKIVVVDAGHGGEDWGSYRDGVVEKTINLAVLQELKANMDQQEDIKVYYTRTEDVLYSTKKVIGLANEVKADFFISIHCNFYSYGNAYGVEAFYGNDFSKSQQIATYGIDKLAEKLDFYNRGPKRDESLSVIHHAKVPSVLFELGFLSDSNDARVLTSKAGQQDAAQALQDTIEQIYKEK